MKKIKKNDLQRILVLRMQKMDDPCITYSELAASIGLDPRSYAFRNLLYEVAKDDCVNRRPISTSIVIYLGGDKIIGDGFFKAAKENGRIFDDELEFMIQEQKAAIKYYKSHDITFSA